jgi:hypothetical protein
VGVGDVDLLHPQVVLLDEIEDLLHVIAGIDDDGLACGLFSNNGAVTLQRSNGDDFVDHEIIVEEGE